jgi:hypothetical protein
MSSTEKERLKDLYMDIEVAVQSIRQDPAQSNLDELKNCLNKFFDNSECMGVLYTPNTDKLFFGLYAFPRIKGDDVIDILFHNKRFIVSRYWLEIDSKLLDERLSLTSQEITALIIHDVGHLVNDSAPAEVVKKEIDKYLTDNNDTLKISNSVHYRGILAYGFADALRKYTTIFEEDHYVATDITDEFIDWCDFAGLVTSAFNKVDRLGYNYNREIQNKFITLSWVLRIYKDIPHNRIPALMGIKRCTELSPSKIEIQELKNLATRISRIDDDSLLEAVVGTDEYRLLEEVRLGITDKDPGRYGMYSILEAVKQDVVAIALEKENLNEPDAVPDLISHINDKLAHIQDYAENDNLSKDEFKQWNNMYQELGKMRNDISKGSLYSTGKHMVNTYTGIGEQ